ncbi:fin bud initiation factor a [Austrofundulus limnaeus]|uniref:Fin bud initiation factor a n=1 Tax=Austrofundulus limnaeus TaxID=52670 RepID=A0A2I4BMU8_AUSLI|nr:PREDICTED: fin bud initiation factor-like [Austrofundulus limnaeus]
MRGPSKSNWQSAPLGGDGGGVGGGGLCNLSLDENSALYPASSPDAARADMMDPVPLLLLLLSSVPAGSAAYSGPLQPEISNGTFHHFFVPDGDYEETVDPEQCQMLFRFSDALPCAASGEEEGSDAAVRDDFIITKLQAEDAARLLESIGRTVAHDLDGEDSYGKFLLREVSQIGEAFSSVDKSLVELEVKFKQSQETELREEQQLSGYVLKQVGDIRGALRETTDISQGLKDKHELLSLIIRSHGTRLSRLKTEFLTVDS